MTTTSSIARVMVRPIATPLPLGFFAFGIGIALTCCVDMRIIPVEDSHDVAIAILSFVAPMEILAAVIAFLARDTAGATTLGIFGGSWVSFGVSQLVGQPGATSPAIAWLFFMMSAAMLVLAGVAVRAKPFFTALLLVSFTRYILAGLQLITGSGGLRWAAAIVGWVDVAIAFYGALALLLEDGAKKTVLPLFRKGPARDALEGDMAAQIDEAHREAGVRKQL